MTVVTGVIVDAIGKKDSREWKVWSPVYAESATGDVVSTRVRTINVTAGIFRAGIDPGVVVLENPDGMRWSVTVPETDIDLWDLIELSVGLPPDTPQDAIQAVVWEYLEGHPIEAGPEGDSAYEVAVANGFVGSQSAWLASLVGPQGEQGEQGIQGIQGIQGVPGADGSGSGDMTKAVYDPGNKNGNAFSQDNMVDGSTNKNFTTAEKTKLNGIEALADVTDAANVAAAGAQMTSGKNANNGYAGLDSSGLIPSSLLPSYVDDVIEAANFAALTGGVAGKIYVTLDNNKTYRWSGSAFVEISASPGSTDSVTEGSTNLYYTQARADARVAAAAATGTGDLVRANSPTLVTPALGTPASGNLANCTFPTLNQSTSGNAATATKLATSRNINGVAFDGSANITISAAAPSVATATVATSETTTSTTYTDLATTTDTITVTVGASGIVQVAVTAWMKASTVDADAFVSFAVSGANTLAADDLRCTGMSTSSGGGHQSTGVVLLTGLTAGSTMFKMKYRVSGSTGTFFNRTISAIAF